MHHRRCSGPVGPLTLLIADVGPGPDAQTQYLLTIPGLVLDGPTLCRVGRLSELLERLDDLKGEVVVVLEGASQRPVDVNAALSEAARQAGLEVVRVFTRRLPSSDVAVSLPFRIVVGATQLADAVNGNRTLLCLLVRKPGYPAPSPGDAK